MSRPQCADSVSYRISVGRGGGQPLRVWSLDADRRGTAAEEEEQCVSGILGMLKSGKVGPQITGRSNRVLKGLGANKIHWDVAQARSCQSRRGPGPA